MTALQWLRVLLLLEAGILLAALPCALLPTDWMAAVHDTLGLGTFPRQPLVEYLTRSASLLYGFWGMLHLYLAIHVLPQVRLIGWLSAWKAVFGLAMLVLDLGVGMPWFWTLGEGPAIIVAGLVGWLLARRVESQQKGPTGSADGVSDG